MDENKPKKRPGFAHIFNNNNMRQLLVLSNLTLKKMGIKFGSRIRHRVAQKCIAMTAVR